MTLTAAKVSSIITDRLDDMFEEIFTEARRFALTDAEVLALIEFPDLREEYAQWVEDGE